MNVLLHPLTHSHLTTLASPYPGASRSHRTKSLPSHWCQIRPSSATYVSGAMDPSMYTLWLMVSLLEHGVVQLVDIALPMGMQPPSAPSVLPLALSLVSSCSVRWLPMSICICIGQGTLIPDSCQQVLLGINNSVWVWCLQITNINNRQMGPQKIANILYGKEPCQWNKMATNRLGKDLYQSYILSKDNIQSIQRTQEELQRTK